jgi:AcrR family transcriptional regulator
MARQKEFDQEKALRKAARLFSQQGFAATSTDELMHVMNVGRQSMYDTFADKRALFLRALEMYVTESRVREQGADNRQTRTICRAEAGVAVVLRLTTHHPAVMIFLRGGAAW